MTTQRATADRIHEGIVATAAAARHDHTARAVLASVAGQEQMVGEILHDLGNFFHKLYYWADYVRSGDAARDGDVSAGAMLEGTIKQLQDYLKAAFDYLAPIALRPIRMTVADVLGSFVGKMSARLCSIPVHVNGLDGLESFDVLVDPSRMSQALDIIVRQVASQVSESSDVAVQVARVNYEGPAGVEVRVVVDHCADPSMFFRTAEASVEWALAEKLVDLHGGRLSQDCGKADEVGLVMFFPVSG